MSIICSLPNSRELFQFVIIVYMSYKLRSYSLSNARENCKYPITTMEDCKKSTESLGSVIYAEARGDGKQLPHGCVLVNVTPGKPTFPGIRMAESKVSI